MVYHDFAVWAFKYFQGLLRGSHSRRCRFFTAVLVHHPSFIKEHFVFLFGDVDGGYVEAIQRILYFARAGDFQFIPVPVHV